MISNNISHAQVNSYDVPLGYVYTGLDRNHSEPDRIGYCLHGTIWNQSRCLHGTILELVRNGSNTGPSKQQVQFWICSGPVPEQSRVNRKPIRPANRTRSVWNWSRVNIALVKSILNILIQCELSLLFCKTSVQTFNLFTKVKPYNVHYDNDFVEGDHLMQDCCNAWLTLQLLNED